MKSIANKINDNLNEKKMKLEKTEDIINLYNTGHDLVAFIDIKLPSIIKAAEDRTSQIDKHQDGFTVGEGIQSFNIPKISYQSFTGFYGSSSTYSDIAGLDSDLFSVYFLKYLNQNQKSILREIGLMMIKDAKHKKEESLKELNILIEKISSIGEVADNSQKED